MGGATKLVLIEENKKPEILISYTGAENDFFFSKQALNGQIKEAIDGLIVNSQNFYQHSYCKHQPLTFSPYHYGLNVLDFTTQTIYSMTDFDLIGSYRIDYLLLMKQTLFQELLKQNTASIYFEKENKHYLIQDFLGTDDAHLAIKLLKAYDIDDLIIDMRKSMNAGISHYANHSFMPDLNCFVKPHDFNFQVHMFDDKQAHQLFITLLNHGIDFTVADINQWISYLDNKSCFNASSEIKEYLTIRREWEQLEQGTLNIEKKTQANIKL